MPLKTCENRLCGIEFEPEETTKNQPADKQQRYCCKDCRYQAYQIGKYKIVRGVQVEVSWPLLNKVEKSLMYEHLLVSHGYAEVKKVFGDTVEIDVAGRIFHLNRKQLVRLCG